MRWARIVWPLVAVRCASGHLIRNHRQRLVLGRTSLRWGCTGCRKRGSGLAGMSIPPPEHVGFQISYALQRKARCTCAVQTSASSACVCPCLSLSSALHGHFGITLHHQASVSLCRGERPQGSRQPPPSHSAQHERRVQQLLQTCSTPHVRSSLSGLDHRKPRPRLPVGFRHRGVLLGRVSLTTRPPLRDTSVLHAHARVHIDRCVCDCVCVVCGIKRLHSQPTTLLLAVQGSLLHRDPVHVARMLGAPAALQGEPLQWVLPHTHTHTHTSSRITR